MAHPRVDQLRFARSEFLRGLAGVTPELAARELGQMNSVAWIVGHMAWHEQLSWLTRCQGLTPRPDLNELVGNGRPKSNPPFDEMLAAWREVTVAADPFLDTLTTSRLSEPISRVQSIGTGMLRVTYHYYVHVGEVSAIRQVVEGGVLPEFVGDIHVDAPWAPDPEP